MSELRAACFRRDVDRDGWPSVSIVVPVRNEGLHLDRAVSSILSQAYPEPFDVCLAVAPSDDDSFDVARRLAVRHEQVSVVANPVGVTPAGLNAAIATTSGSIVVRVDGHAELSAGYIRRAVDTMVATGAVNVGGRQVPKPETPFEAAVASATTSWMGTGGATYRVGGEAASVDTVYLGVFDRAAGDALGWFDETLIRNQDYELNIRIRKAGGTVWFDPELQVAYRPRGTWQAFARQYYEYGWWKAEVVHRHPESLRLRQLLPTVVCITCAAAFVVSLRRPKALVIPLTYATAVTCAARADPRRLGLLTVMHASWAAGFVARTCHAWSRQISATDRDGEPK